MTTYKVGDNVTVRAVMPDGHISSTWHVRTYLESKSSIPAQRLVLLSHVSQVTAVLPSVHVKGFDYPFDAATGRQKSKGYSRWCIAPSTPDEVTLYAANTERERLRGIIREWLYSPVTTEQLRAVVDIISDMAAGVT